MARTRQDVQRWARGGGASYWLDLPWRTRLRLWRTRQVNTAGIWLADHGHWRAAAVLWRIRWW
jgi:hypothetical protein